MQANGNQLTSPQSLQLCVIIGLISVYRQALLQVPRCFSLQETWWHFLLSASVHTGSRWSPSCSFFLSHLAVLICCRYARNVEIQNGRAAMIGFLGTTVVEAATGKGILSQVLWYLKLVNILGPASGF